MAFVLLPDFSSQEKQKLTECPALVQWGLRENCLKKEKQQGTIGIFKGKWATLGSTTSTLSIVNPKSWLLGTCSRHDTEGGILQALHRSAMLLTLWDLDYSSWAMFYPNTLNWFWEKNSFEIINDSHQSNAMWTHSGSFKHHIKEKSSLLLGPPS